MKPFLHALVRNKWPLLAVAVLAITASLFLLVNYQPAALVNGLVISKNRLLKNYAAAAVYQENLAQAYGVEDDQNISALEVKAQVLERLIEAKLIESAVKKEVGRDLAPLLESKLNKHRENSSLRRAATTLYGLDFGDFEKEVLTPQAERDILAGRLFLREENIDDWLAAAKKEARVTIFDKSLRWTGERVVPQSD